MCGKTHARLLIIVTFIENVGSSAIAALTLYVTQYVVGAPQWAPLIIFAYMLPLPHRYRCGYRCPVAGKIPVWIFGMVLTGLSFGGMFFLPFLETVEARLTLIIVMAALLGWPLAVVAQLGLQCRAMSSATMNTKPANGRKALTSRYEFHL